MNMTGVLSASLRTALALGVYTVTFTKSNDEVRTMICTTKHDLIAEVNGREFTPGPLEAGRPVDSDLVTAYDLENLGWRSFYASKVKTFEPFNDADGKHITERL